MNENSLKYKFLDLLFTFWEHHTGLIRFLSVFGLMVLLGSWQKQLMAIPLITVIGVGGYISAQKERS